MILSSSNQISGWTMNFTGSAGAIKIESNTTYPSASFIAVDGDNAIVIAITKNMYVAFPVVKKLPVVLIGKTSSKNKNIKGIIISCFSKL